MDYSSLMMTRRSCRLFRSQTISPEAVEAILKAALLAPSSRDRHTTRFVVVDSPELLMRLADAKESGSAFLRQAPLAVVLADNPLDNDCWVEDASIAAFAMQCQAHDLGVASCWVQIRERYLSDGTKSEDVVKGIVGLEEADRVLCVIAFGLPARDTAPHDEDTLKWENMIIR